MIYGNSCVSHKRSFPTKHTKLYVAASCFVTVLIHVCFCEQPKIFGRLLPHWKSDPGASPVKFKGFFSNSNTISMVMS